MPTLKGFGECTFLEWNAHTPRFWKDGVHLSGIEYSHSEVLERWSTPFWNGMPTLQGVGECTFPELNAHTPRFCKDGVHLSGIE